MACSSVVATGAYLPLLRLDRRAAAQALRWSGLGTSGVGRRSVAGWDEDALTLAVESARHALGTAQPASVVFASTSAPFLDRQQATLLAQALGLPETARTQDVAGSRRSATTTLLHALEAGRPTLVAAGERRPTSPGSASQLAFGDGGASVLTGEDGALRYLGGASRAHDLVDFYASREHPTPYASEERFVRDASISEVLVPTFIEACRTAGIEPGGVTLVAFGEPVSGIYQALAKQLRLNAPNVGLDVAKAAGELGAAAPLFALALAAHRAAVGDVIAVIGYGSGCDVLLFAVTSQLQGADTAAAALSQGLLTSDYVRFLSLTGSLDLDWGVRSEFEQKVQATVLNRYGRDMIGFIGGRDAHGNVQFPKSRIPVNPESKGPEKLEDVRLADLPASLVSWTADRLNYTPDPPFNFGLVQFDNGARVLMELTDAISDSFAVGETLAMRFRVKSLERRRDFRTYFWKAAPISRPTLEAC